MTDLKSSSDWAKAARAELIEAHSSTVRAIEAEDEEIRTEHLMRASAYAHAADYALLRALRRQITLPWDE